jgi:hypothetical protein
MKNAIILILVCVCTSVQAQTNFVKNPSFEVYSLCPTDADQITYCKYWSNIVDTVFRPGSTWASEYFIKCAIGNLHSGLPENNYFYQWPFNGNGMAGASFYFDKTLPPPPVPNYREYLQGRLHSRLKPGKNYCLSFYINLMERSSYAQNKIGAYLDNGAINSWGGVSGEEYTGITPQVYSDSVIRDTFAWMKIEGSFIATGNETHITIGNFFKNEDISVEKVGGSQYSYYLIDDVSVVESDLKADAGPDVKIPVGKAGEIGRVGDTTAGAIDCKWYHKGALIDSGAVIIVNGGSIVGEVDTYVVVQTICGNITRDTALVRTVPVGIWEAGEELYFSIYPNPSEGMVTISGPETAGALLRIYNLLGRMQYHQIVQAFPASLQVNIPPGCYVVELTDIQGNSGRQRVVIH